MDNNHALLLRTKIKSGLYQIEYPVQAVLFNVQIDFDTGFYKIRLRSKVLRGYRVR